MDLASCSQHRGPAGVEQPDRQPHQALQAAAHPQHEGGYTLWPGYAPSAKKLVGGDNRSICAGWRGIWGAQGVCLLSPGSAWLVEQAACMLQWSGDAEFAEGLGVSFPGHLSPVGSSWSAAPQAGW